MKAYPVPLCPLPLWESLAREDSSATFFQTPVWHRIAAAHYNAEAAPLLFEFTRAAETIQACLPLLRDRRWGRDRYFSPFGTYTALLCPRALDDAERAEIGARLATLNLYLAGSPFTHNPVHPASARLPARTQVIDLIPDHADLPARDWAPDPRRRLRIARENGVTVRAAGTPGAGQNSEQDWDAYYNLYLKSLRRWGAKATSGYPRALFDAIRAAAEAPGTSDSVRLWLAEHEGKAAGGYIAFYRNRHACIWHGAADQDYFKLGATQLLYHDMIADAARRGFKVFDMMGSAGLKPLEAFKASVGARTLEYDSFLNRAGWIGALMGKAAALRSFYKTR